ncbi:MAG: glycosyltransferase [Oscillospiraceae bacterium]
MKISVAMCTYNGGQFIGRQLDSIFRQTRLPDEIVVCDDRSGDDTLTILEQYRNRGVDLRIHQNEVNLGFVENFRKCVSLCTGDVIFLADQDDIWKPTKVAELCDLMEANPDILSVVTNFHLIDGEDNRLSSKTEGDSPFFDRKKHRIDWKKDRLYKVKLKAVFCKNIGPGCTQAIRREIIPDFLSCTLPDPHDYVLNRAAALKNGLYYYDKPLTEYRVHGNQTIGIPTFTAAKLRGDWMAMAEEFINLPREFIYHVFLPDSQKVAPPPQLDDTYLFAYYDRISILPELQSEYDQWKKMVINRAMLYTGCSAKWKHLIIQGYYNQYFGFGYGFVERLRLFFWDLAMFLRQKK